jgi:hypothetical protein
MASRAATVELPPRRFGVAGESPTRTEPTTSLQLARLRRSGAERKFLLFFPGAGLSTPAGYGPPQHVDPVVVADIAEWLAPGQGKVGRLLSSLKR